MQGWWATEGRREPHYWRFSHVLGLSVTETVINEIIDFFYVLFFSESDCASFADAIFIVF